MELHPALSALSLLFVGTGVFQLLGVAYLEPFFLDPTPATKAWKLFFLWAAGGMIAAGITLFLLDSGGAV